MHMPLVLHLARRYRDRGEPWDDLVQVGTMGLIKAVDGFDTQREIEFSSYATPTILGEIKRHFRDRTWAVHVPRRIQELHLQLADTTEKLSETLGRSPTIRELATALDVTEEDVLDALDARAARTADSLDSEGDDGPSPVLATWGAIDPGFEAIDDHETLRPLLAALPDRERSILMMRFFGGMSQSQIAGEIGLSQMQVSRLLARSLASMRQASAEATPTVP